MRLSLIYKKWGQHSFSKKMRSSSIFKTLRLTSIFQKLLRLSSIFKKMILSSIFKRILAIVTIKFTNKIIYIYRAAIAAASGKWNPGGPCSRPEKRCVSCSPGRGNFYWLRKFMLAAPITSWSWNIMELLLILHKMFLQIHIWTLSKVFSEMNHFKLQKFLTFNLWKF